MGQNGHFAFNAVSIAARDFGVLYPSEIEDHANVGKLISYVAKQRAVSSTDTIAVSIEPPSKEVRHEAFRRLREAIVRIGGTDPVTIECRTSPDRLVPRPDRHVKWKQLADELQCELPELESPRWAMLFSFFVTYPFVVALLILAVAPLLFLLGMDRDSPPWVILGPIIFIAGLFFGALAAAIAESLLFRNPQRVPFDSVEDFASTVASSGRGIRESLVKNVSTSIDEHVREVVAKQFGLMPSDMNDDFSLIPEAALNKAG